MTRGQYTALVFSFVLCVFGIIVMAISIGTDHWYRVDGATNAPSYYFGLWKRCYWDSLPAGVSKDRLVPSNDKCIYNEFVKPYEKDLPFEEKRYMHLVRSHVALICSSCVVQLATLLVLILGLWPSNSCHCRSLRHVVVYRGAAILALIATLAGMAGGICFIALRDIDHMTPEPNVIVRYDWSFMLAWISTGLSFLQAVIFVYLCRFTTETSDYYYSGKHYLL